MTENTLEKAKKNREERFYKLQEYERINKDLETISNDETIWLDKNGNSNNRILPTVDEYRNFLKVVRDRLDAEIVKLDREFDEL